MTKEHSRHERTGDSRSLQPYTLWIEAEEELGRVWLAALLIGGGTAEREQGALIRIPKGDLEREGELIVGSPGKNEGVARLPNR